MTGTFGWYSEKRTQIPPFPRIALDSARDLRAIKGDLDTFGTVLQQRYGELRKDEVVRWARRRYCHWSGNYIGYQDVPSAV